MFHKLWLWWWHKRKVNIVFCENKSKNIYLYYVVFWIVSFKMIYWSTNPWTYENDFTWKQGICRSNQRGGHAGLVWVINPIIIILVRGDTRMKTNRDWSDMSPSNVNCCQQLPEPRRNPCNRFSERIPWFQFLVPGTVKE